MTKPFQLSPAQRMTSAQIMAKFAIEDGNQNLFHLGCCSERATIFSQQQRALNLAWAFDDSGFLNNKKVGVIGAGFAGITLTAALKQLGHAQSLFLYDRTGHPLHLQRGNLTRFIQPYMYDWPVNGSGYPRTELPHLNWWSSEAGEVAERVLGQWEQIDEPVIKKSARRILSGESIKIRWHDGTIDDFDVVILAVGFGLESGVAADAGISYWSNDALAQSYLGRKTPATVLVSGYGDGGLIDVIRATISKFNHQTFVKKYIHDTGMNEAFLAASVQGNTPGIDWNEVEFPNELKDKLAEDIRIDTDVILNASPKWFFRQNASLFNRLIVALLLQMGAVTLQPGRLTRFRRWYRGRWRVLLYKPWNILTVDHVVPRLGTEKECPKFFLSPVWNATQNKWTNERHNPTADLTAHSHYPDHYLLDRCMSWRGELEYEVVFLCVSDAAATLLLQRIQALAPQPVSSQLFDLLTGTQPFFPDFLVPEWRELFFSRRIHLNQLVCPRALRITTTSSAWLKTFMNAIKYPYYLFGIRVTSQLYEHEGTEQAPYVPILFHGPAIRLKISDAHEGTKWIKVIQSHEDYPLQDAHNLLDADAMLEVARKKWTVERMVEVGWRLTAATGENWRSFTNY